MEKQRCSMAFWGSCVLLATVQVKAPMAHTLEISEVTAAGPAGGTWLDLELLTASISVSLFWWVSRCRNIIPTREHCHLPSTFHGIHPVQSLSLPTAILGAGGSWVRLRQGAKGSEMSASQGALCPVQEVHGNSTADRSSMDM